MKDLEKFRLHEMTLTTEENEYYIEAIRRNINHIKKTTEQRLLIDKIIKNLNDKKYLPTYNEVEYVFQNSNYQLWLDYINNEESMVYELLNRDYIKALADYIIKNYTCINNLTVLEAGAGNGKLTHFLKERINSLNIKDINFIATDSGDWNIKPIFSVEQININEALNKYNPEVVLFSWMPYKIDYTQIIRNCESVNEYILIGESDYGCCGNSWLTWGADNYEDKYEEKPYIKDGFNRKDLIYLKELQICRTDTPNNFNHSSTVSFKRNT